MWTGLMLSLVLCQAKTDAPPVKLTNVTEYRYKTTEKAFFPQPSTLSINATLHGQAAKDAIKMGNLKVTEAQDDQKTDLVMRKKGPDDFGPSSDQPEYRLIQTYERDMDTKDNVRFYLTVNAAPRASKKVTVKGTVDLLGGTPSTIEFAKAKSLEGTALKNADLDALKLKITVVKPGKDFFGKPENTLLLKIEGDERPIIDNETVMVDSTGKKIDGYSSFSFRTPDDVKNKTRTLSINTNGAIPVDAKLQIKFIKGPKVVTVPFEFKEVELP